MTLFFIILFNLFMAAVIYLALNLKLAKMTEAGLSKKFKEDFVTILDEFNQTADANISLLEDRITSLDRLISCLDDFAEKNPNPKGEIRPQGKSPVSSWRRKKSIDLYDDNSFKEKEKLQAKDETFSKTVEAIDRPLNPLRGVRPPEGDVEFTSGKTVDAIDQDLSVNNEKEKKGNIKPSVVKKNFFGGLSKSLATFKNGILKRYKESGFSGQTKKSNSVIKSGAKPAKYKIKPGNDNKLMENFLPEDLITINSKKFKNNDLISPNKLSFISRVEKNPDSSSQSYTPSKGKEGSLPGREKLENNELRDSGLAKNFDSDEYQAGEIDKLLDQDMPFYEFNRRERGKFSHNIENEERLGHPDSIDEMNETTAILPSDFWQMSKDDRFQYIADLVHQGFPVSDLSALTHMSLGEIELIASLNKNH